MDRERLAWESGLRLAVDALALVMAWGGAVAVRSLFPAFDADGHLVLGAIFTGLTLGVMGARGEYHPARPAHRSPIRLGVHAGLAAALLTLVLFALDVEWVSRPVVLAAALLTIPALMVGRGLRIGWRGEADAARVVVVGSKEQAELLAQDLELRPEWGARVVARVGPEGHDLRYRGGVGSLPGVLRSLAVSDVVCLGGTNAEDLAAAAAACDEVGARLSLDASFLGAKAGRAELRELDGLTLVSFHPIPGRGTELAIKRAIDIGVGVGLLLIAAPTLIVLMAAIRLQDGGPALFSQVRLGRYGKPFRMYKLRSMRVGSEASRPVLDLTNEAEGPWFKLRADPRVTPLGRWLRSSSLDELPQLVNVIRGEMSLVGPRPPLPDEVARYTQPQRRRLSMRPGLTGLWQVSGRSTLPFDRALELDLAYIDTWNLQQDVSLLIRTVPAVVRGTGAW